MEEHKLVEESPRAQVIEKRLSKGIIRRRIKVDVQPPSPVVESIKPFIVEPVKVVASIPLVAVPAEPQVAAEMAKEQAVPIPETPKTETTKPELRVVAPVRESDIAVPAPVLPRAVEAPLARKTAATQVGEEIVKDVDALKRAKSGLLKKDDHTSRPLTFQERLRGTISLDKLKPRVPGKKTAEGVAQAGATEVSENGDSAEKIAEAARKEKEKAAKGRKPGVKVIGGDLDIDGMGKATTLTHLVRTAALDRVFRPDAMGGKKKKIISRKKIKQTPLTQKKAAKRFIEVHGGISVRDFAQQLGVKSGEVIKKLMELGVMATINQTLDMDTATLVAQDYQYETRDVSFKEASLLETAPEKTDTVAADNRQTRPPVVTIMGHVDHGKTSLLDAIRSTNVTEGEAGGITQHIGAYTVSLPQGRITFLDTPGHEAFSTMRARGAKATDLVVLVVAADDGVMPQTQESIAHAKSAGVPMIVAVNKIDKPEANPERVMRQLSEHGVLSEEWGGDTQFIKVSAKSKAGIPELLERILLVAEVAVLKADPSARAVGVVLEAKLDRFRGPVATLLVQNGTLKVGDPIVVGTVQGKVKAMSDWTGNQSPEASASMAVEVLGLEDVPSAGDVFNVVASEQDAKTLSGHRMDEKRKLEVAQSGKVSLEDMFAKLKSGQIKEFGIILKTDVQGSLEAVRDAVMKLGNDEVKPKIVHSAVGGIKETDVNLALTTGSVIIGFNVRPETKTIHFAKDKGVEIKLYKIIYELVDEVKLALGGLLTPTIKENYLGRAEVRKTFEVSKLGLIAGCMVVDGLIARNANIRLLRDNIVIHEGKIVSLKRLKDDAREVKQGFDCGVGIEGYQGIKDGDLIEAFTIEEIQRTL